jgi:3',5'-cyclic AMP phosphodiesterase CpdA
MRAMRWCRRVSHVWLLLLSSTTPFSCSSKCVPISQLDFHRAAPVVYRQDVPPHARRIALLGDTQRTSFQECLLGRPVNDARQWRLVRGLVQDEPDMVLHLGDMVFAPSSTESWQYFDALMEPVAGANIPVLPILGNHEYGLNEHGSWRQRAVRFSRLAARSFYQVEVGPLGVIMIDSNRDHLGDAWNEQRRFFERTIGDYQARCDIRAVVVLSHHPVVTRRTNIPPSDDLREDLVPRFLASPKSLAWFSGHTHVYERYVVYGRHFIASSGGGGPQPSELLDKSSDCFEDVSTAADPFPLHYVLVNLGRDGIQIAPRYVDRGGTPRPLERPFYLPYPG